MARTPRNPLKTPDRVFWWQTPRESNLDDSKIHEKVCEAARWLDRETGWRNERRERWRRYYEGLDYSDLTATERMYLGAFGEGTPLTVNATEMVVDAWHAKIAKQKPRPIVMTMGGNYKARKRAQGKAKVLAGEFYENDAFEQGAEASLDCAQVGDGFLQVAIKHGKVRYDRTLAECLLVDDYEARFGYRNVRQLIKCSNVHKEIVKSWRPDLAEKIDSAECIRLSDSEGLTQSQVSDMVTVVEAWHLDSGGDANDGRYVMAITTATLADKPYKHPDFPFARFSFGKRSRGFWHKGIVMATEGITLEIYRLLAKVSEHYGVGAAKFLLEQATHINEADLDDSAHGFIRWDGRVEPKFIAPPPINPAYMDQFDRLLNLAFESIGLSKLSSQGTLPPGLDRGSGEALRTYYDIDTDRWSLSSQGYERAFVQLAKLTFRAIQDYTATGKKYAVVSVGDRDLELVDWDEVRLDDDKYRVQIFNTSFLPSTPAGQIAAITELLDRGLIEPIYALQLLRFSDLESVTRLALAPLEDAQRLVEEVLDSGEYQEPDEASDLALIAKIGHSQALRAKEDGYPETNIEALRLFVARSKVKSQVKAALTAPPQPQMPMQPGMPGMAGGNPMDAGALGGMPPGSSSPIMPPVQ